MTDGLIGLYLQDAFLYALVLQVELLKLYIIISQIWFWLSFEIKVSYIKGIYFIKIRFVHVTESLVISLMKIRFRATGKVFIYSVQKYKIKYNFYNSDPHNIRVVVKKYKSVPFNKSLIILSFQNTVITYLKEKKKKIRQPPLGWPIKFDQTKTPITSQIVGP